MTLERSLLTRARDAGINLSATLVAALGAELRHYESRKWQEENHETLEALNRFHDEYGCFSDDYKTFQMQLTVYSNNDKSAVYP